MQRTLAVIAWVVLIFALRGDDKPQDGSCYIGSAHNCHCPKMVARDREKVDQDAVRDCLDKYKTVGAARTACMEKAGMHEYCSIIMYYDSDHPNETCKSACKKDSCRCSDEGPACKVFHYDYHGDESY